MKLLKDISIDNDIKYKKYRKTQSGSHIIDFEENIFQTCWLEIHNDIENNMCLNASKITNLINSIDENIIKHCVKTLGLTEDRIRQIYIPILKYKKHLIFNIGTNTVMFDSEKVVYDSPFIIKKNLKKGDYIRTIMCFKKICFKEYEIKCIIDLLQIEKFNMRIIL